MWKNIYSIILLLCEIGIIIAYGRGSEYSTVNWLNLYPVFQDIHVMIFVGFGFLMVFLKRVRALPHQTSIVSLIFYA